MTNPSICIPRLENNITKKRLMDVFEKYALGDIDRVDLVKCGPHSKRGFIHFKKWNLQSALGKDVYNRLKKNEKVNIIYSFPWFWKCSLSRLQKPC
jgi:hypothetical protein